MNKKKIFVIYDEFNKQGFIPNGFNMSSTEELRYRFKIHVPNAIKFGPNYLLKELTNVDIIPIHIETFVADKKFFKTNGEIIYPISIHLGSDCYYEFFAAGMNNWINYLNPKVINSIKNDGVVLVLSGVFELFPIKHMNNILDQVKNQLGSLKNIQIWHPWTVPTPLVSMDHAIPEEHQQSIIDVPFWEIKALELEKYNRTNSLNRSKKFISLNRRYTPDRVLTYMFLLDEHLVQEGYVSMPDVNSLETSQSLKDYANTIVLKEFGELSSNIIKNCNLYWDKNPMGDIIDMKPITDLNRTFGSNSYYGFPEKYSLENQFNDSFMSLINEAEFNKKLNFMISEKTFRAIMFEHLFILIGPRHILKSLRAKGYLTFNNVWDESYDDIEDNTQRLFRALEIFKDIIKNTDIASIWKEAQPILEHNRNHLLKRVNDFKNK